MAVSCSASCCNSLCLLKLFGSGSGSAFICRGGTRHRKCGGGSTGCFGTNLGIRLPLRLLADEASDGLTSLSALTAGPGCGAEVGLGCGGCLCATRTHSDFTFTRWRGGASSLGCSSLQAFSPPTKMSSFLDGCPTMPPVKALLAERHTARPDNAYDVANSNLFTLR